MKIILNMKILFYSLLLIRVTFAGFGQECTGYHQYHCRYTDYTYYYSRQSKSLQFHKGQETVIQIVAYAGEDYYLAVCGNQKLGKIRFRIMEDNASKTVLFDNADNEYSESVIFTNEATRNLIIELSTSGGSARESKYSGCVGLVVEFRKTTNPE